jgi:serine protease Do
MNTHLRRVVPCAIPFLFLVVPCLALQSAKPAIPSALEQLSDSLQAVVRKVSPSIVKIEVSGYTRSEQDEDSPRSQRGSHILTRTHSIGSGVILDSDGYIITNAHVLEGARRVRVTLDEKLRKSYPQSVGNRASITFEAKIIGSFEEADLAVVKIDARGLPSIRIAESDIIQPGQLVFALGSPEGFKNSVSIGVVSAVGRISESDGGATYIQTDATISAGSSGGALVDMKGDLIGITSFMITEGGGSEGLGFALPSKLVYSVFQALKNTGHVEYGDVGIRVQNVTPELAAGLQLAQEWGIIVSDLDPGSLAATAGVQVQDIILTLDGSAISSSPQFVAALYHKKPGDHVRLGLLRGQRQFSVDVRVFEHEHASEKSPETANLDRGLVAKLGVLCAQVSGDDHLTHPTLRSDSGVMVVARLANSDTKNELASGDVIQSVNGTKVTNVDTLRALIDKLDPGSAAVLRIERRKQFKYIAIEID